MWNSGVSGFAGARAGVTPGGARGETPAVVPVAEVAALKQLLNELFDAQQDGKSQTVRETRDKLNALREKIGDEPFKNLLKKLIEDADRKFLQFLKQLLSGWFPEDDAALPSLPLPGGGGSGPRVRPENFGSVESMSNKPFTQGARFTHYTPDKSNPGKKPGMGREPGNIWSGFRQGPDGNCVTVSAIKSAMMKFGQKPTDIFRDVKAAGDGWDVQMRDGFQLHLSKGELQQAAQQARFLGDDPAMMTDANFLYAASAKRAQMEGNNGFGEGNDHNARRSYLDALVSLNDGEHASEGLDRLGLKGLYRQSSRDELASGALGVVNYGGHSMAVIGGQVELWGGRGGRPQQEQRGEAYAFV
ncbi:MULTISPECIES: hypothetical protein [Pseudomonas]|jgi:hypothetical protein|uniref:hypothetical protein n=1 Tax=Pseudomonas TaxID=286 RepID=UPI001B6CD89D|nr:MULTISPECIES: hypothetical protein [unclassified Pseudomonas]MBP1125731.1 hypothetical protein [Pseudomonas sp. PvP025]MDQ0399591.1 hypothetical protein [Pseudomonas sp. PvP006]